GPAAEALAPRDVAAPEDRVARGAGVRRPREEHEVAAREGAGERVVVDMRLEARVVVAHLATGTPVEVDVGRLGGDVLLAAVELHALNAPGREERGELVAPPGLRRGVGWIHDEARAADVGAVGRADGTGHVVAERLRLEAVVAGRGAARPEAAPR